MEFVARAIAVADKTSAIVETWLDDRSDAVERLASTQARFQRECAALRLQLEKALAAARSAKRNGAAKTRESVALEFAAHLRGYFGARDDARAVLDDLEDACADFIAVGIAQY